MRKVAPRMIFSLFTFMKVMSRVCAKCRKMDESQIVKYFDIAEREKLEADPGSEGCYS